jgi:hypothetical protein
MPTGTPGTLDYYLSMITSQYAGINNPISIIDSTLTPILTTEDGSIITVNGDTIVVDGDVVLETFTSKFVATLTNLIVPFTEVILLAQNMYQYFNIDTALDDQLTKLGAWLHVPRSVPQPLTGVYFTLDSSTLGLDQGSMLGPGDSLTGLVNLPDDVYRDFIKAYIFLYSNPPTKVSYYTALSPLFAPAQLIIQGDNGNNLFYGLLSNPNNAIVTSLFTQGFFNFAPAGVGTYGFIIGNNPWFGFDVESTIFSGLDVGYMI